MIEKDSMVNRQKIAITSLVVIVTCVLLMLLAEGAVRLRALLKYGYVWGVETTFEIDSRIGLRVLKAGTEFGPIRVNNLGFRGPDIDAKKPSGRVRIAFLGGSTTFCAEVSSNELTWPNLVVNAISKAFPGSDLDYVNGAVPGYGTDSSLKNLKYRVGNLEPDVIIIYHATNDLSANSFAVAREQGLVEKRAAGEKMWLSNYSLLVYLAELNFRIMRNQHKSQSEASRLKIDEAQLATPFYEDLTSLVDASTKVAKLVVLPTFTTQMRTEQSSARKAAAARSSMYYMPYMTPDSLVEAFAVYNRVIRDVAREKRALLIDAEFAIPGDNTHFIDSVHFTDAGSKVMAARVVQGLLESDQFLQLLNPDASRRE